MQLMLKTLIVDDREIFLIELKRLKVWGESTGFTIAGQASNGSQALDLLRKNTYDLVITDIRMPIMDGLHLLMEIKKENLCPCVVFLSEYSEFNFARQGIVLGAFDYLVKPVLETSIIELLKRAKNFLESKYNKQNNSDSYLDEKLGWLYPIAEEKTIINYFKSKDASVVQLFFITMENLYMAMIDNIIEADIIVKKLYYNIITAVYEEYKWLNNFIDFKFFEKVDFFHDNNKTFKDYYCKRIEYLLASIIKLMPASSDQNIKDICEYLLNNPEGDLKLKLIAEKFFMNNTYLSNSFFVKTGIHFNDYVTIIKMSRAEYLFTNSSLKTYEIGYKIGYLDINYFLKQFKKVYGQSPTEYRNSACQI